MNCGKRMGRMKETKKFKDNWQKYFGPALGIGAVFLIWYLVCRMEMVSAYVLPSPARVWTSFLKMVKTGELWRDPAIPSPAYYGGILEGYRQNGLPVPELEAALKNVHDEVRQARHFERMQEMDLFSGEKPGRKKGHHER